MPVTNRYLVKNICRDLSRKMVFLAGPRQVGKTTFARELVGAALPYQYYNWDKLAQRRAALKGTWEPDKRLVILDEFHKHRRWKTWIKGEYDTHKGRYSFLLTGSARLDIYRRGGDSLQGRFHSYRLHPFSLSEIGGRLAEIFPFEELAFQAPDKGAFDSLFHYGGFPEPFLTQDETESRRWHNERMELFFREDIRDLTRIQEMGQLSLFAELLPEKVSSVLSINSLATDLQVNHRTAAHWLDVFENFYHCFRLAPFASRRIASVRKEKKLYLWDWAQVPRHPARVENLVASHLLKFCHYLQDAKGYKTTLHYLRDSTGREVDFLVCCDLKPWFAVEVKTADINLSRHLFYFRERLRIPFVYQLVGEGEKEYVKDNIRVMPVEKFLTGLV